MSWQPHTRRPLDPKQTVIVAVPCAIDGQPYLLAELYRWEERFGCWIGENSGLRIKHAVFWWLAETELLASLPAQP